VATYSVVNNTTYSRAVVRNFIGGGVQYGGQRTNEWPKVKSVTKGHERDGKKPLGFFAMKWCILVQK